MLLVSGDYAFIDCLFDWIKLITGLRLFDYRMIMKSVIPLDFGVGYSAPN